MLLYLLSHSCSAGSARNRNLGAAEEIFDKEVDLKASKWFLQVFSSKLVTGCFCNCCHTPAALAAPGLELLALLKKLDKEVDLKASKWFLQVF